MPAPTKTRLYRSLEILPGALAWATFFVSIVLSYFMPVWVAYFIILFDIYWLFKALNIAAHLIFTHRKIKLHARRAWLARLQGLADVGGLILQLKNEQARQKRFAAEDLAEEVERLERLRLTAPAIDFHKILHIILLPSVKEPFEVLEASIRSYQASDYPLDRLLLVLALEERAGEHAQQIAAQVQERFAGVFGRLLVTLHPDGIAGEAKTKGANISYAARQALAAVDEMRQPYEQVIVSAFDADTVVRRDYFSQLTYTFLTAADPTHASYQPVPVYNNNVWEAPAVNRLVAINSSFWQMVESSRADRLVTFSSHSMSLRALVDADFWPVNVISEDSQIFWRCFLHYHGNYRTEPLFTTVSLDAVVLDSYLHSLAGQYKQNRRWAWGVVDFPYVITGFIRDRQIPFWKKFLYGYRLLEGHYFWATAALMIAFLGWLPLLLGSARIDNQVFAANLPQVTGDIMTASTFFLILNVALYFSIIPQRPADRSRYHIIFLALQWVLIPISQIFFAAIPAIDAQTRLMFGRYMEFWVTPKVRRSATVAVAKEVQT